MKEQVFISYRRKGGVETAKLICETLKGKGYNVFFDFDSLRGGYFDDRIFEAIGGCNDFILVLSENALDRCVNEDDWVRQEIMYALKTGKNIVPVMLQGFDFPDVLPKEIENVKRHNGVLFVMNYYESVMESIIKRLTSKPLNTKDESSEPKNPFSSDGTMGKAPKGAASDRAGYDSLIRSVCSFGSCDFNNIAPADAFYSETIDRNRYNIVYFSISTALINKTKINARITIYDDRGNVALDDSTSFNWAPNYNLLVLSWVIRGRDGSFVKVGKYKAVFRIDNSKEYEYEFNVVANATTSTVSNTSSTFSNVTSKISNATSKFFNTTSKSYNTTVTPPQNTNNESTIKNKRLLEVFLAAPKLFKKYLLCLVPLIALFYSATSSSGIVITIFGIATLIAGIPLFLDTYKLVVKNYILALLIVTIGFAYYGWFLAIVSICGIFKGDKWRAELNS